MKIKSALVVALIGFGVLKNYGNLPEGISPLNGSSGYAYQQQQAIYARQERERIYQAEILAAQQQELALIYSKDPWRNINGETNLARRSGWYEFQGQIQESLLDGVVFKGRYGQILQVHTDPDYNEHLVETLNSEQTKQKVGQANQSSFQQVRDTSIERRLIYGDDLFYVEKFPYPASKGQGYQQMMAMDGDYFTYTNNFGQIITIHKLIYGIPCAKISASSAVAAEKQIAESQKQAVINAAVKFNQVAAQRGDAYGLLRMGERYRDGDGVEKDLSKAKIYLSKAADAGSTTAVEELSRLTGN